MKLKDYIDQNFSGSQVEFAKFLGVTKQAVNRMIKSGYIVSGNAIFSKRFDLPKVEKMKIEVAITKDRSDNEFGVAGYEVVLSSRMHTITAFINKKNIVTSNPDQYIHGLFKEPPYKSEFVDQAYTSVQKAFESWTPETKSIYVSI